jgi:hypothetical protein
MERDTIRAIRKTLSSVSGAFDSIDSELLSDCLDKCVETETIYDEPDDDSELETPFSGMSKLIVRGQEYLPQKSIKAKNIAVNWKKLLAILPETIGFGITSNSPVLMALFAIIIARTLISSATIKLEESHGIILASIVELSRKSAIDIDDELVFAKATEIAKRHAENELSRNAYFKKVRDLEKWGCIDITKGRIRLSEKISE